MSAGDGSKNHRFVISKALKNKLHAGAAATRARVDRGWTQTSVRGIVDENAALLLEHRLPEPEPAVLVMARSAERGQPDATAAATTTEAATKRQRRFVETEIAVANVDTLTAALVLGNGTCILSFANAEIPGGRYVSNGRAQEEDLCRLIPQLYPSLVAASKAYPLVAGRALVSDNLVCCRLPGSYELVFERSNGPHQTNGYATTSDDGDDGGDGDRPRAPTAASAPAPELTRGGGGGDGTPTVTVITAAMPCGPKRPAGGWLSPQSEWAADVRLRIGSVFRAAVESGHPNLVLGAFGCGAFGNPAQHVAALFKEQLQSDEFRGAFERVVFAIIDPVGTGNLKPFVDAFAKMD